MTYESYGNIQEAKEVERVQNLHVTTGDIDGVYVGSTVGKSDMKLNPKHNV